MSEGVCHAPRDALGPLKFCFALCVNDATPSPYWALMEDRAAAGTNSAQQRELPVPPQPSAAPAPFRRARPTRSPSVHVLFRDEQQAQANTGAAAAAAAAADQGRAPWSAWTAPQSGSTGVGTSASTTHDLSAPPPAAAAGGSSQQQPQRRPRARSDISSFFSFARLPSSHDTGATRRGELARGEEHATGRSGTTEDQGPDAELTSSLSPRTYMPTSQGEHVERSTRCFC